MPVFPAKNSATVAAGAVFFFKSRDYIKKIFQRRKSQIQDLHYRKINDLQRAVFKGLTPKSKPATKDGFSSVPSGKLAGISLTKRLD